MTINITETSLYTASIVVLVAIQIYQQRRINRLEKDNDDLWAQMATLTSSFVAKMLDLAKTKDDK